MPVPLDIGLTICVRPGFLTSHVKAAVAEALGPGRLRDGTPAFFNPEKFSFGQPLFLSALYQAALAVPGVQLVVVNRLQRLGTPSTVALDTGELWMGRFEVVRCDSNPDFPDRGRIALDMVGGA